MRNPLGLLLPSREDIQRSRHVGVAAKAKVLGRPFWQVVFTNGVEVDETQCDWLHLPRLARRELRLFCPDGRVVVVGATGDHTGRLFQFKCAHADVGYGQSTDCHVVGVVNDVEGNCSIWAWYVHPRRLVGPVADNVRDVKFENVGPLCAAHLGLEG